LDLSPSSKPNGRNLAKRKLGGEKNGGASRRLFLMPNGSDKTAVGEKAKKRLGIEGEGANSTVMNPQGISRWTRSSLIYIKYKEGRGKGSQKFLSPSFIQKPA